jgi:hypothetical protein
MERRGGPLDPLLWFKELYDSILKNRLQGKTLEEYPLYKELL